MRLPDIRSTRNQFENDLTEILLFGHKISGRTLLIALLVPGRREEETAGELLLQDRRDREESSLQEGTGVRGVSFYCVFCQGYILRIILLPC